MKIVYIAGPYSDKDGYLAIDRNIALAREAAAWLASNGIGFVCPHLNSAHFEAIVPEVPVDFWYEMDLRILKSCDAMLMLPFSDYSTGAIRERYDFETMERGPVFEWDEDFPTDLLAWARGEA